MVNSKSRSRRRADADYFHLLKEQKVKKFFDTGDPSHLVEARKLSELAAAQCDPKTGQI